MPFSDQESAQQSVEGEWKKVKWRKNGEMTDKKCIWEQGRKEQEGEFTRKSNNEKVGISTFFSSHFFTMIFVSHAGLLSQNYQNFKLYATILVVSIDIV